MNIPQLPTDNMYKFIAISGLILMVTGGVMLLQSKYYMFDVGEEVYDEIYSQVKNDGFGFVTSEEVPDEQYIPGEDHDIGQLLQAKLKRAEERVNFAKNVSRLFMFSGLFIFGIGLLSWYNKCQRYIDIRYKALDF